MYVILSKKIIKSGAFNKKHINKTITYGITLIENITLERTKETCT